MVASSISNKPPEVLNFEDILEAIGGFGLFQILMLLIILGFEIPTAFIGFVPVFTGILPQYWKCQGIRVDSEEACHCNGTLTPIDPGMSIVTEWNLVCDLAWVSDLINTTQMIGMLVGVLTVSQLADWYGRKYTTLGSGIFMGVGSLISAVSPNPYLYAAGRIMCGAGFSALQNITGVYALEFLPVTRRSLCACAGLYGWGTALLAVVAYYVRPWRQLSWVITTPLILFCPLLLLIPESPRFLIRQSRLAEATAAINYIAKINGGTVISEELVAEVAAKEKCSADTTTKRSTYFDLFRRSDLRQKTFCWSSIWFSWGLVYFGIYFNMKNVPGNLYLSVVYMGVADMVGFPATFFFMDRLGRQRSVVVTMSLGAVVLVTLAVLQICLDLALYPILVLAFCTLAKFFMAMGRCASKCFVAESFPTDIRGIGTGFCGMAVAVGAAICPQVVFIGTLAPSVPFFVFAVIGMSGSIFTFFIAETSGKPLQESALRKLSIISSLFVKMSSTSSQAT